MSASSSRPSPPPAVTKVFDTYELLESILLHLPLTDLLQSPAVCKQWRDVHNDSSPIQQAIFKKPLSKASLRYCSIDDQDEKSEDGDVEIWRDSSNQVQGAPVVNPFIQRLLGETEDDGSGLLLRNCVKHNGRSLNRSDASWRGMLVSQPVATKIPFFCVEHEDWHVKVCNNGGITSGDLADFIIDHVPSCQSCGYTDDCCMEPPGAHTFVDFRENIKQETVTGWEMLEVLRRGGRQLSNSMIADRMRKVQEY